MSHTVLPGQVPRPVDHVVMPVVSLEASRTFFAALGFTVAADAQHPFGTENACVFFADGTYFEPLGIASRETCEVEARGGNVFVARDQAFRFRRGTGFSGIAFGTTDAAGDDEAFRQAGLSDGKSLDFSRLLQLPDGRTRALSFRLAFAADRRAPDLSLFTVQALAPPSDRSALTAHANGVTGMSRIVLSEPNPTDFQYFLQDVVRRRDIAADSFGMSVEAANGVVLDVLSPDGLAARFGRRRGEERGLLIEGVLLSVPDFRQVSSFIDAAGLSAAMVAGRIVVPVPVSDGGQGGFIAFEAAR